MFLNLLDLRAQREGDLPSSLGRLIDPEYELKRFPAGATVGVRLRLATEHAEDVPVVALVPVAVYGRRVRGRDVDELVIVVVLGERPVLDLVDGGPADFHGALLAEDRDRALEVPRVCQHRDLDRAERAVAELEDRDAGVFGFDAPGERGGFRGDTLDRADEPLDQ